jgi:hypothetical protein
MTYDTGNLLLKKSYIGGTKEFFRTLRTHQAIQIRNTKNT